MIRKSRQTLITAEIMGFFLIIIALLGILTDRPVFRTLAIIIFVMIVVAAAAFAVFATLAVKEERGTLRKKK
ncbi:hypothetical protein ACFL3V_03645 [Nanoarchaeota archaeon]